MLVILIIFFSFLLPPPFIQGSSSNDVDMYLEEWQESNIKSYLLSFTLQIQLCQLSSHNISRIWALFKRFIAMIFWLSPCLHSFSTTMNPQSQQLGGLTQPLLGGLSDTLLLIATSVYYSLNVTTRWFICHRIYTCCYFCLEISLLMVYKYFVVKSMLNMTLSEVFLKNTIKIHFLSLSTFFSSLNLSHLII